MTPYHAAALALGHSLRLLPRRLRWRALLRAARLVTPLVPRADGSGAPGLGIDGYHEIALWRLMAATAVAGVSYDPAVEHRGLEHFEAALASAGGVLLAGPHSLLLYLTLRLLHDRGRSFVAITATPDLPIFGTKANAPAILVSESLLGEAVRHLRAGDFVCAMLDRPGPEPKAFEVPTPIGPVYLSDALLRFALRERAGILFCDARIVGGNVILTWSAAGQATPEGARADFAAFVAARIAEGHGRAGPRAQALGTAEFST